MPPLAILILEYEEFAVLAGNFHRLESDIAADAVFLMHDGSAGREILQIPQNGFGIDGSTFAPSLLPGAPFPGAQDRFFLRMAPSTSSLFPPPSTTPSH